MSVCLSVFPYDTCKSNRIDPNFVDMMTSRHSVLAIRDFAMMRYTNPWLSSTTIDIDMIWVPKINNQRHTAGYRPYMNGVDFVSPMNRIICPVSQKTEHPTLAHSFAKIVDRFSNFFHQRGLNSKPAMKYSLAIPPHLKRIATLPCGT